MGGGGAYYSDSAGVIVRFSTGSFTSRPLSEVRIQSAETLQRVDGERSCVKYMPRHKANAGAPVTALWSSPTTFVFAAECNDLHAWCWGWS